MRRNIITWDRPSGRQTFQLFVNEPVPFTQGSIDYGEYDTFISHKGDDMALAERAGGILYESGLSGYWIGGIQRSMEIRLSWKLTRGK